MQAAKLPVPTARDGTYEFTAHEQMTVADFKAHVVANSDGAIKNFDLRAAGNSETSDEMALGDLT